ncbi:DUF2251 domain-containing protein [Desulfoluna spongiiphila]|uniref:DUF2251 domain-containing protein n=1 Tax=Desulfoluna spongiiphila TaxID=419481 RepID=UPI0020C907FF|nr:DUF2251 domain-containing protein [Desulfoluna spongiiphila]
MAQSMIYEEQQIMIGQETVVECRSPENGFMVVFEDDGKTGYFYGLDTALHGNPILDALHIYDAENVSDAHLPSTVQVVWSGDGLKSLLLINNYPHAVFNFEDKRGYCKSNFPPADLRWSKFSHEWSDSALELFD